jgi:glyoxylase-like metal-dependent hydrolase (beta-lactamase superfamily II)/rhodanese-related sulfurtransferase
VIFEQLLDGDLGCACYLIGDKEAGIAVVVDPPYAVEPVLTAAARHDVHIIRVIETHTHADHVSGHGRLALEHGVPVSIHPNARVDFAHDPLHDGDELKVGAITFRVVHSPGHRPEHCCLVVTDTSRGDEPWLVLTGDSLFVGDVARPDLAVGAREGAEGLFHSLQRLMELADGVEVFPGHVAGSLCGKAMSSKPSTTIGFERKFNPALRFTEVDAFIADAASIAAPKPPNLARIVELNRGPFLAAPRAVEELAVPPAETQLLDVRTVEAHLAGHRPGAVNVPVSGTSFGTKAGFMLDASRPATVLASTADEAGRGARGLQSVALLDLAGFVLGGGDERTEAVEVDDLDRLVQAGAEVIDVREKDERDSGYIPGSRNVPYRLLTMCCPDIPAERTVVTICETGARAAIAASILRARGYDARPVIEGGMAAWRARGGDTVVFRRCGSNP